MEKHKNSYNNNKFKILAPTWNTKFELSYGLYSVSNIQDYNLKKHGENMEKPSVQTYVNKILKKITFKINDIHTLEPLTPETMKLFGKSYPQFFLDDTLYELVRVLETLVASDVI